MTWTEPTATDPDWSPKPLDLLLGYTPGMVLPTIGEMDWHPEFTPKNKPTHEGYLRWRMAIQKGRTRALEEKAWKRLRRLEISGDRLRDEVLARIDHLIAIGKIDLSEYPGDEASAREALAYTATVFKDKRQTTKDRLAASKLFLEYTKTKPVAKSEVTIKSAEDFLDALDEDDADPA